MTGVECRYRHPSTFGDAVAVRVWVEEFCGVRLAVGYDMRNTATDVLVATGRTVHCFVNGEGRPTILRRQFPALDDLLRTLAEEHEKQQEAEA